MAERDDGSNSTDPNDPLVRKRTGQSPAQAHYADGSGYLDAQSKAEVQGGRKSGLHRRRRGKR